MWLQLPKLGIVPRQEEVDDYVALFRYIDYLLASPTEYIETSEKAKAVMESMFWHEVEPTLIPRSSATTSSNVWKTCHL